jgi:hypothetical protein
MDADIEIFQGGKFIGVKVGSIMFRVLINDQNLKDKLGRLQHERESLQRNSC